MSKLNIDISGRGGLAPNFAGDLNDTSAQPHLRYIGDDGQFADGVFNPIKQFGYLSPANNTYIDLTGSTNANIIATEYDSINDDAFLAEAGAVIWKLDGFDDTSLSTYITVNQTGTETLTDLNIYEINGARALFYAYNISNTPGAYSRIGMIGLDDDSGISLYSSLSFENTNVVDTIDAGGAVEGLAQSYQPTSAIEFNRVRLPLAVGASDDGGYTVQVDIQKDDWTENTGSLDLDGGDDSIYISDGGQTGLDLQDDFTFECWFKPDSAANAQVLISKWYGNDVATSAYRFRQQGSGLYLQMTDTGGTNTEETVSYTFADDSWYHIAVTRDKTAGEVKFYVYGTQAGTTQTATTNQLYNSNADFIIGSTDSTTVHQGFTAGNIKEVRVWSDVRTQTEIFDNVYATLTGSEANLVGYWKLNDSGVYTDETTNNNDLTSEGSPAHSTSCPPGIPDGVSLATGTINPTVLPDTGSSEEQSIVNFDLSSTVSIAEDEKFFIIVEPTTFGDMTASDSLQWLGRTDNPIIGNSYPFTYDGTDFLVGDQDTDFAFQLILTGDQNWSDEWVAGTAQFSASADLFMLNSDNGRMYIFEDNYVHGVNGTTTGGGGGTLSTDLLTFPSYFKIVDAVDTRGLMYIAVQSDNADDAATDVRNYSETQVGVYSWDRRSDVVGTQDFLPLYGVRDIKKIYVTPEGDLRIICIANDRFTEIRSISNGGQVVERLGIDAFPTTRDSLKIMNNMTVWLAQDGIWYAHGSIAPGEPERLFKIGDMTGEITGSGTPGAILIGDDVSAQSRQSIIFAFDDGNGQNVNRWYPHGEGTIDSNAQKGHIGNSYTLNVNFGTIAQVNFIRLYCKPTSSSGATTIATAKVYYNQNTTAGATTTITQKLANDGFIYIKLGQKNIRSIQVEIENSTTQTLGTNDFRPYLLEVDYDVTDKVK